MDGWSDGLTDIVAFDGGDIFITSQYRGLLGYAAESVYPLADQIITLQLLEHLPNCGQHALQHIAAYRVACTRLKILWFEFLL